MCGNIQTVNYGNQPSSSLPPSLHTLNTLPPYIPPPLLLWTVNLLSYRSHTLSSSYLRPPLFHHACLDSGKASNLALLSPSTSLSLTMENSSEAKWVWLATPRRWLSPWGAHFSCCRQASLLRCERLSKARLYANLSPSPLQWHWGGWRGFQSYAGYELIICRESYSPTKTLLLKTWD